MSVLVEDTVRLDPRAFKKLYPEQYFDKFFAEGVRPDGRPLAGTREVTVGLGTVSTAESSASVKIGQTTVLGSIKLETASADPNRPKLSEFLINVELTPLASPEYKAGRQPDAACVLVDQVRRAIIDSGTVEDDALLIPGTSLTWVLYMDLYVVDADGALLDACLLAALACLSHLSFPTLAVNSSDKVVAVDPELAPEGSSIVGMPPLQLRERPLGVSCILYRQRLILDPTADEEALAEGILMPVVTSKGLVVSLQKSGGMEASPQKILECIEAAKIRYLEFSKALQMADSSS
eukprot:jgi/Botrbrau1/22926/Bobra.0030s0004.1